MAKCDLVFEGGGVKGIALVGALAKLEDAGYEVQNRAGASAGSMVAALHGAGYTARELADITKDAPFASLLDKSWHDKVPFLGKPYSIVRDQGIYEGRKLRDWMKGLLADQKVEKFGDMVVDDSVDELRYRYRFQAIVSDLTARRLLVLPADAAHLGIEPDELDVALAVRASASIPVFFEPAHIDNPNTGRTHVLVDGGMLSNFPVWIFDSDTVPKWPTFGLDLDKEEPSDRARRIMQPTNLVGYLWSLLSTMLEAHDRRRLERTTEVRTIRIPTLGVGTTDFELASQRADELFQSSHDAAGEFLADWDFDAYKREFRNE